MEYYALIALAIVVLAAVGIVLFARRNPRLGREEQLHTQIRESFFQSDAMTSQKLDNFLERLRSSQGEEFERLRAAVEGRLDRISARVQENLDEGFKKTNQTFGSVLERLAKIDEAQRKIEDLSSSVVSLQDVLTDKKVRGMFGEVQLKQILASVFSEGKNIYQMQKRLSNGTQVDALLNLPEPLGNIPVDSKFPLENYKRMVDKTASQEARRSAEREFKQDLKKHIKDIADKYLPPPETADQAILFLPAEAVFAEVHAHHTEVVEYAHSLKVWLTSPTTFLATLATVNTILINMERDKHMHVIHQHLKKLGEEFSRYEERWSNLAKHIKAVGKDVDQLDTTSGKISKRFREIEGVEITQNNLDWRD